MSETVYYINGRCYSCGGTARVNVRVARCRGCGGEVGSMGWVQPGSPDAERIDRLARAYDGGLPLTERTALAVRPATSQDTPDAEGGEG